MICGTNRYRGRLRQKMDARTAVGAYDLAVEFAERRIRRIVSRFVGGLRCPGECPELEYESDSLTFDVRRVSGRPSPTLPNHYRIIIEVTYRFRVSCSQEPVPQPEEEEEGPVEDDSVETTTEEGSTSETEEDQPDPNVPCTISFSITDNSTRSGQGIATWNFDVTITASASNQAHSWAPRSCVITAVNYSAGGAPLNWTLANALGTTTSLMTGFGITVAPGAGEGTIQGSLVPGIGGIAGLPGSTVQILGAAIDSAGDTNSFEYIVQQP